VFENRVLRRISGPESDELTGSWRQLHNEELHNPYSSPSIIRMNKSRSIRWAVMLQEWGEKECMYHVPEGKRPLGKIRRRWEDNSKMDLGKIGWGNVD
jgi:hypothetical protein